MSTRFWPLETGRIVTSPFGKRGNEWHAGTDFGFPGGSGGKKVFSVSEGRVLYAGAAQGYGGPDPHGWLVVQAPSGAVWEYGHITRLPNIRVGAQVSAGQHIAHINPEFKTNGGTAPHLHLSFMPNGYDPNTKRDPLPALAGALEPAKEMTVGWTGDPLWLADVLGAQQPKLKVRELESWQQYGHGDYRDLWGVMVHHTGNARETAESIRRGRPDLPGPLSNLHIAPDGTVTVVAAGVCWHAGQGSYPGIPTNMANFHLIGIECAWPMDTTLTPATQTRERWPDAQIIAMRDSVAAILTRLGFSAERVIGHKEWAGAAQGKWDPGNLDMRWFRGEVAKAMRGEFKPQPEKPKEWPRDATDRELLEAIYRKVVL
jgi:hypothetical protein